MSKLLFSLTSGLKKKINRQSAENFISLAVLDLGKKFVKKNIKFFKYPFFTSDDTLINSGIKVLGKFQKIKINTLRKFGYMGFKIYKNKIYACAYKSIHVINLKTFKLEKILINDLMYNLHSIDIHKNKIIFSSGFDNLEYIVICDLNSKIEKIYTLDKFLNFKKIQEPHKIKLRNIQIKKSTSGPFHINHIQIYKKNILLTSRQLSAMIVINPKNKAYILAKKSPTSTSWHDGKIINKNIYFTSINSKIFIYKNFNLKDLSNEKLIQFDVDPTHSWCRGIEKYKDFIYTSNKGLYGYSHFELLKLNIKNNKKSRISIKKNTMHKNPLRFVNIFCIQKF
jgi:hypothetical protein